MSVPPPPNQWGSQPPTGGQPAGAPQWGPPTGGQPGGVPQQPWGPPPRRGGKGKWIFGGIALLAVIAVTVVITVLVVGNNSGGESPTRGTGNGSDIASANDKGPANVITEDPTCDAWGRVAREYSSATKAVNWGNRDQSIPASAWTPDQRAMYEAAGKAMTSAADETIKLVKSTPYRVMRELYEQFIAYGRSFADTVPTYTAQDDSLAVATDSVASGLSAICSAIDNRSAPTLAALIPDPDPPTTVSSLGDLANPGRFLMNSNPVCADWSQLLDKASADTAAWRDIDPKNPSK